MDDPWTVRGRSAEGGPINGMSGLFLNSIDGFGQGLGPTHGLDDGHFQFQGSLPSMNFGFAEPRKKERGMEPLGAPGVPHLSFRFVVVLGMVFVTETL